MHQVQVHACSAHLGFSDVYIHFKEFIEPLRCLDQLPPMICEVTCKPISFDSNSRLASMCNSMSVVSQSNRRSAHVAVNDWGQARPRTLIYSSASLPVSPLVIDLYISAVCSCSVHVVALTLQYVRTYGHFWHINLMSHPSVGW